jgi:hypothetical protein
MKTTKHGGGEDERERENKIAFARKGKIKYLIYMLKFIELHQSV